MLHFNYVTQLNLGTSHEITNSHGFKLLFRDEIGE